MSRKEKEKTSTCVFIGTQLSLRVSFIFTLMLAVWAGYLLRPIGNSLRRTAWQAPAFDDASWSEGPTEIGFGDGDEATVVSSSPATFYFRKAFTLAAPVPLLADLIFDDGAIVYVNGVEVNHSISPRCVVVF